MRIDTVQPTLAAPTVRALLAGLRAVLDPSRHGGELERQLQTLFPGPSILPFASGRAALVAAIRVAMHATGRSEIVLPAYTSFSVAAAVAAAGARARLCDLDPDTLDFDRRDLGRCVGDNTGALLLGNLFGYPSLTQDLSWVRERGVVLIDDAAQALGAGVAGDQVGGRGDLGVLSFGRGKCVTTGDGGALLAQDREFLDVARNLARSDRRRGLGVWLVAGAVSVSASRLAFGLLSRLPGARVGESRYEPTFPIMGAPASVDGLAVDLADAVKRQLASRSRVARAWMDVLGADNSVRVVTRGVDSWCAFLRFPVFASDQREREHMVRALSKVGFAHVRSYPTTLARIEAFRQSCTALRTTPGADEIANTLIALPCHAQVRAHDIERAAAALRRTINSRSRNTSVPVTAD